MATTDQPVPTPAPSAPVDRSQFIRTMAKDMAAIGGASPNTRATPAPAPEPKREDPPVAGVTLPKTEEPFFERPQSRAEREADVPVALPSMQEAGAIVTPAAETPKEDREAVLARLREKVSQSAQMSIQQSPAPAVPAAAPQAEKSWPDIPTPPPSFAAPTAATPTPMIPEPVAPAPMPAQPVWQNVPNPAPAFTPMAEPQPSRLPPLERAPGKDTYREVIEEAAPARPNAAPAPDRMHTYSSDFSKRIDTQGASTFSVLAAEQDSATPRVATLPKKQGGGKALLAIGSGVLLITLAIGGVFMTYQFVMTMRDTPIAALTVPSIVVADEYEELSGTGQELMGALAANAGSALVPGNVIVAYILEDMSEEGGGVVKTPAGGAAFLRALQVPAPDILLRNIAKESVAGAVNVRGESSVFFALRVDSYERTYAGMLTWEPLMLRDLSVLYPLHPAAAAPEPANATTTTASTTVATSAPAVLDPIPASALSRFSDAVVANHDVRVLRDTSGRALLLYGYADKRTLIIARDEAAFEALLPRLKAE